MPSKMQYAKNPYTNTITLRELAASKRKAIRCAVAANRNLQAFMMKELTQDVSVKVRIALAGNPKLSDAAWEILSEDSSEDVQAALKEHHPERPEKVDARKAV